MCFIPNPCETLAASGEQKLIVISGENFLTMIDSFLILSALDCNFTKFSPPPCFPMFENLV